MNRRITLLAGSLACALGGALPVIAAEEPVPEAEGEARLCISLHAIRNTRVLDGQTILFEMAGKKTLVNRLPRKCPGLAFEKRFAYKTSLSQLCNSDIITVITDIGRGASCGLGKFEPYVAPEPEAAKPDGGKLEKVE
jgi:hypothetical protein